jgi:hypothetical protein
MIFARSANKRLPITKEVSLRKVSRKYMSLILHASSRPLAPLYNCKMAAQTDSPLSITASVTGILTFVVAIFAAVYARLTYLRNANSEYFRVKASLSWYKTESSWSGSCFHALRSEELRECLEGILTAVLAPLLLLSPSLF